MITGKTGHPLKFCTLENMSEMLRFPAWNQKKLGAFLANVFGCYISSGNYFFKYDIDNLIDMIIYVKKTVEA